MKYLLSLVLLCACGAETSLQGSTLAQVGKSDTTSDVGQDSVSSVETQTSEKDAASEDTFIPTASDTILDSVDVGGADPDTFASPDAAVSPDVPNVPPDAGVDTGNADSNLAPEVKDKDSDQDGLLDSQEAVYGTNPYDPDTDKDGLSDGVEVASWKTNPLSVDTDKDGLSDGIETGKVLDADSQTTTDPSNPDTDGDGVLDGFEDKNKNGKVDPGEANPSDPSDMGMPSKPVVDPCEGKSCDDGNVCTQDSCQKGVCSHVPVPGGCDDGNPCTKIDTCVASGCTSGVNTCEKPVPPCTWLEFFEAKQSILWDTYQNQPPSCATCKTPQIIKTKSFWASTLQVSGSDYQTCVKAGACAPANNTLYVRVDAQQAGNYCKWVGGRLPNAEEMVVYNNFWWMENYSNLQICATPWAGVKPAPYSKMFYSCGGLLPVYWMVPPEWVMDKSTILYEKYTMLGADAKAEPFAENLVRCVFDVKPTCK